VRMIIDTDVGVDDAQAIIMALRHPGVTVEAITTVTGNVHVSQVNKNVCTVLDVLGADVPVYPGADQPLVPGFWKPEERAHGSDGLGNMPDRKESTRALETEPAAVALVRLAREAPNEHTLVALGPLTNIALACRLDPLFPALIKKFVFMGGTISAIGNTERVTAEFNLHSDPEAAAIVLDAFPESTMLSWETTLKHPFTWEQYNALAATDTPIGRFFRATTANTMQFLQQVHSAGYLLPDPLAMAITLDPGLVQRSSFLHVTVELQGMYTRGQTVIDYASTLGRQPNVNVVFDLDITGVHAFYQKMLA
jgi:purine nucleosidase